MLREVKCGTAPLPTGSPGQKGVQRESQRLLCEFTHPIPIKQRVNNLEIYLNLCVPDGLLRQHFEGREVDGVENRL